MSHWLCQVLACLACTKEASYQDKVGIVPACLLVIVCLDPVVSGSCELGSSCIVTGPLCVYPGFGGLGVLPGVATGTGLNPKSRTET